MLHNIFFAPISSPLVWGALTTVTLNNVAFRKLNSRPYHNKKQEVCDWCFSGTSERNNPKLKDIQRLHESLVYSNKCN